MPSVTAHSTLAPRTLNATASTRGYRLSRSEKLKVLCRLRTTAPRRCKASRASRAEKYEWTFKDKKPSPGVDNVEELRLQDIRRPLQGTRSNDSEKVEALMESITEIGLQEPIDVLLVEGTYYGFSGCHRFEACQRLGKDKILAKVRKANRQILKMHFM